MYTNNIVKDIENIQNIYITVHINPDGDAVGSAFAFAKAMKKLGKEPVILMESYDARFDELNGKQYIFTGDYDSLNPEIIFSLDCATMDRLGKAKSVFERTKLRYNIDHHISNTKFADYNIVNGSASSASEVVYEIISKIVSIDKDIATSIYTGILTDTGGFMYSSTSKRTHQIAGELVEIGLDTSFIHSKMLKEHTIAQVKVFNKALQNLVLDGKVAYTTLTSDEMQACGVTSADLDGIVEYILNINGIEASLFATERGADLVKLSLRSKSINVNEVAGLFGGGGHMLAAGAGVKGKSLDEAVKSAVDELKNRLI